MKQILQWCPLIAKRDKATGRVMKLDGTVAAIGERVPVQQQFLVPDPKRRGITWRRFVHLLEGMGYQVEWRIIKACDFGAPTSRERLFMIARCDGQPIVWPEPTHAKHPVKGQQKWRTAADCIDWSVPSNSIFGRKKELAAATLRRVAKGMKKFVLDNPQPFIVPIANWSGELAQSAHEPLRTVTSWPRGGSFAMASPVILPATHQAADRVNNPANPLPTFTAANRGEMMMASPEMIGAGGPVYAGKPAPVDQPMGTLMTQNHRALVTAFIEQANGGFNTTPAKGADEPLTTVTNTGSQQRLVTASLATLRRNCVGRAVDEPVPTMTAGAEHHARSSTSCHQKMRKAPCASRRS